MFVRYHEFVDGGSALGAPTPNPFSPGFGETPLALVGRDDILTDLGSGLSTGPSDTRYTSVISGVRGSGKTVILNEIEDRAASDGWVVLSMDSTTNGLLDRIANTIAQAGEGHEGLNMATAGSSEISRSIGINLGLLSGQWETSKAAGPRTRGGLREQLTALTSAAQRAGTSVLLTVDELHAIDREEARRLAGDLQHITKRARMPLAFVGAGLAEMQMTLMLDKKLTFFHRCEQYTTEPLTPTDAASGLRRTVIEAEGSIDKDALMAAASFVRGSPYRLQVIGHTAWKMAGAPKGVVDADAVESSLDLADETVTRNVSIPAWHDLSGDEQMFVGAVLALGEQAALAPVASRCEMTDKRAGFVEDKLVVSGYLARGPDHSLALTDLIPAHLVARQTTASRQPPPLGRLPAPPGADAFANRRTRCRQWMPRARAHCMLPAGHSGRCRSR